MSRLLLALLVFDAALIGASVWLLKTPRSFDDAGYRREAEAYCEYQCKFGPAQIGPAECRSPADFEELEQALAGPLRPPANYRWDATPAVALFRKWQDDLAIFRDAQQRLVDWYAEQDRRGQELLVAPHYDAAWARAVMALMEEPLPIPVTGPAAGSSKLPMRRGAPLPREAIHDSDRVDQARHYWQVTARRLTGGPAFIEFLASLVGWH